MRGAAGGLGGRVRALEARSRRRPPCALCGGVAALRFVMGEDAPDPAPCPSCGTEPVVVRVVEAKDPRSPEEKQRLRERSA